MPYFKTNKLLLLSCLLACLLAFTVDLLADDDGTWTYRLSNDEAIITGCVATCPAKLVIPSTVDGYSVTEIGYGAFQKNDPYAKNTRITTAIIPEPVRVIGDAAFAGSPLENLQLPESLVDIGYQAFTGTQLVEVVIPNSVKNIGDGAFSYSKIKNLTLGLSLETIGKQAFQRHFLYEAPNRVVISDTVTEIGFGAFSNTVSASESEAKNAFSVNIVRATRPENSSRPYFQERFYKQSVTVNFVDEDFPQIDKVVCREIVIEAGTEFDELEVLKEFCSTTNTSGVVDWIDRIYNYETKINLLRSNVDPEVISENQLVQFTITDYHGNTTWARNISFALRDTISPTISLIGSESLGVLLNSEYLDSGAAAVDSFDKNPQIEISGNVDVQERGTYLLSYQAIDASGNKSETVTREVVVDSDTDLDGELDFVDADIDGDGVLNGIDAFPLDVTESVDTDSDGTGNNADTDDDGDDVADISDAFPLDSAEAIDSDSDGVSDNADTDDDNDQVKDSADAFPLDASESVDTDADGVGNNADTDDDGDGVADIDDAFSLDATETADTDADGIGDNADTDDDGDEVLDGSDAFPLDVTESVDTDSDGIGNNADTDDDNDGVNDAADAFPLDRTEYIDSDNDGVGNNADVFPDDPEENADTDGDGVGNNADRDDDNDGVEDSDDDFPIDPNESLDTDLDGVGNNEDNDDDNDGVADLEDAFPLDPTESSDSDGDGFGDNTDVFPNDSLEWLDTDQDGIGNNFDGDDDNDLVVDDLDAFPLDASESVDSDSDGIGDNADTDDDNDGVADALDAFPLDATESRDTDSDGIGDNVDADDDGDGVKDSTDAFPLDASESVDTDGDGLGNNVDLDDDDDNFTDEQELADGTDPLSRFSCRTGCFSFDVDENLEAQPLTDGLLVIRHLFGFSGDSLTSGAVSSDASRDASDTIASYLTDADSQLDIDGDGESKPLTDGLLLIRYLFGFSGDSLISGAIGTGAERDTAEEVEAYIKERVPGE